MILKVSFIYISTYIGYLAGVERNDSAFLYNQTTDE